MTVGVCDRVTPTPIHAPAQLPAIDWNAAGRPDWYWYVRRAQLAALHWPKPGSYSKEEYLRVLNLSGLRASEMRTMAVMADFATSRGVTSVDRATISREVAVSQWTVTQHWKKSRERGLLKSRRRFDSSSVHHLLVSADSACALDEDVQDKRAHVWGDSELSWWASIGTSAPLQPPWGEGRPPF